MVRTFGLMSAVVLLAPIGLGFVWSSSYYLYWVLLPVFAIGVMDALQTRHSIRRNFPVIGNLRYFFEFIRPELQQYFVENNQDGKPISRENRSIVYQRAKGDLQSVPFGTQHDVYGENYEWVEHSILPKKPDLLAFRVSIGGPQCAKPYAASLLNVSAMSFGSISGAATEALNRGAAAGQFYHNTGEGGIATQHQKGGDLVWQLGTGYFGCRLPNGRFDRETFALRAKLPVVKMIELKLSQGAKPGKGGLLPGAKVSPVIAEARGVEPYKTVVSPNAHSEFDSPLGLLKFIDELRTLSGGKPVGFKLCVGRKSEFVAICKAMLALKIYPDFITVDGAEGGTGAAPLEFSNHVGVPLNEGLSFVHNTLVGFGLREHIRLIAAGKVMTAFHLLSKLALGADLCNSARGMMLALGCIQALKCNANTCPAGVATTDPQLERGLYIPSKAERVARFHKETLVALGDLVGAMGHIDPSQIKRHEIYRRLTDERVVTYEDLYPSVAPNSYLPYLHSALGAETHSATGAETHSATGAFGGIAAQSCGVIGDAQLQLAIRTATADRF